MLEVTRAKDVVDAEGGRDDPGGEVLVGEHGTAFLEWRVP